jgi:DNA repair photolyase
MAIIYEPSGKAREYAALACNLYTGCNHGCLYCYAPGICRMTRDEFSIPKPRKNILHEFEKDCEKIYGSKKAVLFCFMTDPYNSEEERQGITREALKLCLQYKIPVKLLTKSVLVLRDIETIQKFGKSITVGMTLTMDNIRDSIYWEAKAATPGDRIGVLKILHDAKIHTWASFEPVIDTVQSLNMILRCHGIVDHYKIGKLNNYGGLAKKIDWVDFLTDVTTIMRGIKPFYIKKDLRECAPSVELLEEEIQADRFEPESF